MQQLDVELLFPTGPSAAPAAEPALQRRRGRVRRAELSIEQAELNRSLSAVLARRLGTASPLPFDLVRVRIDGGDAVATLLVLFRCPARPAPSEKGVLPGETDDGTERGPLWGTARIAARRPPPGATDIVFGISEVRLYGRSRLSAPLVGHLLLQTLGAALVACPFEEPVPVTLGSGISPIGLHLVSTPALSELRVELLHDTILDVLPRAGYRAADPATAPLCELQPLPGQLILRYAADGQRGALSYSDIDERPRSNPMIEPAAVAMGAPLPEPLRIADHLLYSGDISAALAAYSLISISALLAPVARIRRLQTLIMAPSRWQEAAELGEAELQNSATSSAALISLALLADYAGNPEGAARRFLALGADLHCHAIERAAAFFAAARYLMRSDPQAAQGARGAAESLLDTGGPEEPLLEAIHAAAQEAPRKRVSLPPAVPAVAADSMASPAPTISSVAAIPPPQAASLRLLIEDAQALAARGEIEQSRALLLGAGAHPDVLRARVQLDWPELLQAEPGSPADLLPVLRELAQVGEARPEELRGLARLLTLRGEYAEALAVQKQAQADPDELLASLEAAGRHRELLAALRVHAIHRPDVACLLYQQAASVAEQQLNARAVAAAFWQQAAEASSDDCAGEGAALLWFHAGRLWYEHGDLERAYAVLGQAAALRAAQLPRLLLLLADVAYALGDLDAASRHYRQVLDAGLVPAEGRARAYLRVAEAAQRRGDRLAEEQALAHAVEAGGGAEAWPKLAALFRAQNDRERLGAALLAWAEHQPKEERAPLLHEAASLVQPALLPQVDEALVRLGADDEAVRDRVLDRIAARGAEGELLVALERDVNRSRGDRRRRQGQRLCELGLKLSVYGAAIAGFLAILAESDEEVLKEALAFYGTLQRARAYLHVPAPLLESLRQRIIEVGRLQKRAAELELALEKTSEDPSERENRRSLLEKAAKIAEILGYYEKAAQRYLDLAALIEPDRETLERLRRVLRSLAQAGRAEEALALVYGALQKLGPAGARAIGLRIALAELLTFLGRNAEALGQIELTFLQTSDFGPAHALLGMLLGTSAEPGEAERGLLHLLRAAYAHDVEAHEAGECALMAADMLASAGIDEPVELSELRRVDPPVPSYAERATLGTFVAVPMDFLEPVLAEEELGAKKSTREGEDKPSAARDFSPPLPARIGPVELLLHAAALLPGDPRPLEGLLGLSWSRGDDSQALECCDRLLALPTIAASATERSRIRVEKAHVLLRLERRTEAEALLRQALLDVPSSAPALRALRRLICEGENGPPAEALTLLDAEMKLCADEQSATLAGLWNELGLLQTKLGHQAAGLEAYRRAGQLGLADGWRHLAEGLTEQGDFLGAADAAGRAALLLPADAADTERGPLLLSAADLALRADDELRARDYLAQVILQGGDSSELAEERLRSLDGGPDLEKRRRTLERRLKQSASGIERLEILRRLTLLCAELYERTAMVSYANMLLRETNDDALALCVLAEDAIERGQPELAASRIVQAVAIPPNYPRATRLLTCLGEVRERRGDMAGAEAAYKRLLESAERSGDGPAIDLAIEGLARLAEETGDAKEALRWLRRRLPYLPPDALAARTTLRLRMSDFAMALGDLDEARLQLNAVLEESPGQRSALVKLLDVYKQIDEPQAAMRVLDRLLDLTMTPGERAEWLFARAELCEHKLGDLNEAAALYEQVLSQWPAHARALRRVIAIGAQRADRGRVAAAVAALAKSGAPLLDVQVLAGVTLLLPAGEEDSTQPEGAQPGRALDGQALLRAASPETLAAALVTVAKGLETRAERAAVQGGDLRLLDGALAGALQALGGHADSLQAALKNMMRQHGAFDSSTGAVLARLLEQRGLGAQRLYLAALAFLDPGGYADEKIDELGALPISEAALESALAAVQPISEAQAPWLAAFGMLGRHVLGMQVPAQGSVSRVPAEVAERLLELGRSLGLPYIEVALVAQLEGDIAACDPTRPPRLRMAQALMKNEPEMCFAALRALHLLRAGMPLCERGGPDEMVALLRAAAALWLGGLAGIPRVEDIEEQSGREREWLATLRALALHPEHAPSVLYEARAEAEAIQACLARLEKEPRCLAELWPALLSTMRLYASARALGQLGDLRAALRALFASAVTANDWCDTRTRRLFALRDGHLAELLSLAARLYE